MSKFDTVDFVYETKVNTKITENSHTDEKELEQNDDCTERYDKNEINSKDTLVKILERKQNSVINDANENLEKEIETNNQTQNDLENEETKLHYQQTTANDAVPAHKSKSTQLKNLEEISINSYLIEENILNKTKQLDTEMIPEISVNGEISKKCQQSDNKNNHTIIEPLRVVAASISELEKNVKLTTETVENEQTTSKNENVHSQIAVVDLNSEVTNEEITHQKANNINKETSTSKQQLIDTVNLEIQEENTAVKNSDNYFKEKTQKTNTMKNTKRLEFERWDSTRSCLFTIFLILFFLWIIAYYAYVNGYLNGLIHKINLVIEKIKIK